MPASPIPRAAAPVVWFIRWWVKKPRTLPGFNFFGKPRFGKQVRCPMGLIPSADDFCPTDAAGAGMAPDTWKLDRACLAFAGWWDSQTDARAAVDAVWPNE